MYLFLVNTYIKRNEFMIWKVVSAECRRSDIKRVRSTSLISLRLHEADTTFHFMNELCFVFIIYINNNIWGVFAIYIADSLF